MSPDQLWPVFQSGDLAFLIPVASTALVFYEYAITIGLEAQQIWNREVSVATALFVLTRYITLLDRLFVIISVLTSYSFEACTVLTWVQAITTSMLIVVISAIAAVRIFALWSRDWRLFALIMIPGLFPALTNLYLRSVSAVVPVPSNLYTFRTVPTAMSALTYKNLSIAARVVSILADGTVVMLTWLKTYRIFVLTKGMALRTNYSTLILRDGTLYFLAVCVLNAIAIVYIMHTSSNLLNDIIVTLSSILMSRFLLNLRRHRTRSATGRQSMTPTPSMGISPSFRSDRTFPSDVSHSMGRSTMSDDTDHDSADPGWDIELVAVLRVSVSGRHDALASVSTTATLAKSWPSKELLVPGSEKDTAGDAEPVDRD
ncbi:hypothetical protein V8D89_002724 [Ganoderma adspersum]